MTKKYDIHSDFDKFPVINISFSAVVMWLINTLMKVQRFFTKRSYNLAIHKHRISRPDGSTLKVITMTPYNLDKPAPALIYYHGGGFGMTYASTHLDSCERYANEAGCIVIFVDYRLGPRHPFPGGFDDCYSALDWAIRQSGELGIDVSRIAVGGDSAGGALAAGVAQKARDENLARLCAQLLIYPVLDNSCSTPSATNFVDVPLWNATSNRRMWDMYLSRYTGSQAPAYAAPAHGLTRDLPRSYIETAEFDPLRDEGLAYAAALRDQDIEVVTNETKRTVHGYDGIANSEIAKRSMLTRIEFLADTFRAAGG